MFSVEKIIQIIKKEGKIIVKEKNEKEIIILIKNQGFTLEIDASKIIIRGNKDSNNSICDTAKNAEEIKEILKKFVQLKEIQIEIQ